MHDSSLAGGHITRSDQRHTPFELHTTGLWYDDLGVSLQACVRERASKSLLCVQDITESEARQAVDSVFDTCFQDTDPFERVPP